MAAKKRSQFGAKPSKRGRKSRIEQLVEFLRSKQEPDGFTSPITYAELLRALGMRGSNQLAELIGEATKRGLLEVQRVGQLKFKVIDPDPKATCTCGGEECLGES